MNDVLSYFGILVFLYLTPFLGYFIAKSCGKEPQQGKKAFTMLALIIPLLMLLWLSWQLSLYVLLFGLVLFLPLYFLHHNALSPLSGFLYVFSAFQPQTHYAVASLLFIRGLVVGTNCLSQRRKIETLWPEELPFLVIGLVAWIATISFK